MTTSQISSNSADAPVERFGPQRSKTLTGLADIAIPELGLLVRAELHASGEARWAVPIEAWHDGQTVELRFGDAGARNAFAQKVLAALDGGAS